MPVERLLGSAMAGMQAKVCVLQRDHSGRFCGLMAETLLAQHIRLQMNALVIDQASITLAQAACMVCTPEHHRAVGR